MGKKYICEVQKDNNNNELKLVHPGKYYTKATSKEGVIQFKDNGDMYQYFNKNCISEEQLANSGNNLFMFLFFLLLLIFLITLMCQMLNKGNPGSMSSAPTEFGRFSI